MVDKLPTNLPTNLRELFNVDPNSQDERGNTVLHKFVLFNICYRGILRKLIDRGTNLETRNEDGQTAFLLATAYCRHRMMKSLIDNGADVHTKDGLERNALHYLSLPDRTPYRSRSVCPGLVYIYRVFPYLEKLLKKGVEVNLPDYQGNTPLMFAARGGHLKVVKKLLEYGASVDYTTKFNSRTCLHLATMLTIHNGVLWNERNSDIISELILNGASVNHFDLEGRTALGYIFKAQHSSKHFFAKAYLTAASLVHWEKRIDFYVNRNEWLGELRSHLYLIKHVDKCYNEIDNMKSYKLSEVSNLCQFALRGAYVLEESIASKENETVLYALLMGAFPLYQRIILSRMKRSYLRRKLIELDIYTRSEGQKISLMPVVIFKMTSFLDIYDLFNAFKAYWQCSKL